MSAMAIASARTRAPAGCSRPRCGPRSALVVGLGRTGVSCVDYLSAKGLRVSVVDSRREPPGLDALRERRPWIDVHCGGFDPARFESAELLVVSPGVSLREPCIARAAARGVPVIGDVELFARAADAPVVAITGSNGKTTVCSMVAGMAKAAGRAVQAGANLGPPALSLLERDADLYVLELSSFQLERTSSLHAAAAAVLNVSADHLDRYRDLQEYAATKRRIYHHAAVAVVNRDDPLVRSMVEPGHRQITFSLSEPRSGEFGLRNTVAGPWLACGADLLMPVAGLPLGGRHNAANALAALALGHAAGLPMPTMIEALGSFRGLAHRCELVTSAGGVRWYDDSKATNVGATLAAIEGLGEGRTLVLIAGGEGKGADFSPLRPAVAARVAAAVLIGRDAPRLEAAIRGATAVHHATSLEAAVDLAACLSRPGGGVLFSPACASFDMFEDYRARGEAFAGLVRRRAHS